MAFGLKGSRTAPFTSSASSRCCLSPCGSVSEAGLGARVSCLPEASCSEGSGAVAKSKSRRRHAFSGDSLGWGDLPQDALDGHTRPFHDRRSPVLSSQWDILPDCSPALASRQTLENTLLESITETPSYLARQPTPDLLTFLKFKCDGLLILQHGGRLPGLGISISERHIEPHILCELPHNSQVWGLIKILGVFLKPAEQKPEYGSGGREGWREVESEAWPCFSRGALGPIR